MYDTAYQPVIDAFSDWLFAPSALDDRVTPARLRHGRICCNMGWEAYRNAVVALEGDDALDAVDDPVHALGLRWHDEAARNDHGRRT